MNNEEIIIIYKDTADGKEITIIPGVYATLLEWFEEHSSISSEGFYNINGYGAFKFFKGKEMKLVAKEKIVEIKLEPIEE